MFRIFFLICLAGILISGCNRSDQPGGDHWSVAVGEYHCLFIDPNGVLYAVGNNQMGQLGNPELGFLVPSPMRVPDIGRIAQAAVGLSHSVVLTTNGDVYTFGDNMHGQLGIPNLRYADRPTRVHALDGAVKIAASGAHSMALMPSGVLYGWGSNHQNQLGLMHGEYASRPTMLFGGRQVSDFATNTKGGVVLTHDGHITTLGKVPSLNMCCYLSDSKLVNDGDFFGVVNPIDHQVMPFRQATQSSVRLSSRTESKGYDAYQRLDSSTWLGILPNGKFQYAGHPCGFPAR